MRFIAVCPSICSSKQLNRIKGRSSFFHFRGLLMPVCRSPLFLPENKQTKKKWRKFYGKRVLPLCQRAKGQSQRADIQKST